MNALGKAQVVAFSQYACQSTRAVADVILPIGALPEIEATLTNLDGREQRAVAAGKLPGQARAGWRVLRALGGLLDAPGFEFSELSGLRAGLKSPVAATGADKPVSKQAWFQADEQETLEAAQATAPASTGNGPASGGAFELVVSQAIYRSDATVRRAAALQAHPLNAGARIVLHPRDAQAASLAEGMVAKVSNGTGTATLPVATSDRVASGCAWIESGYGATAPLQTAGKVEVCGA
jgi:NADH-quinone oxidoreductase subunit G